MMGDALSGERLEPVAGVVEVPLEAQQARLLLRECSPHPAQLTAALCRLLFGRGLLCWSLLR